MSIIGAIGTICALYMVAFGACYLVKKCYGSQPPTCCISNFFYDIGDVIDCCTDRTQEEVGCCTNPDVKKANLELGQKITNLSNSNENQTKNFNN